jgi:hypothetical protein
MTPGALVVRGSLIDELAGGALECIRRIGLVSQCGRGSVPGVARGGTLGQIGPASGGRPSLAGPSPNLAQVRYRVRGGRGPTPETTIPLLATRTQLAEQPSLMVTTQRQTVPAQADRIPWSSIALGDGRSGVSNLQGVLASLVDMGVRELASPP